MFFNTCVVSYLARRWSLLLCEVCMYAALLSTPSALAAMAPSSKRGATHVADPAAKVPRVQPPEPKVPTPQAAAGSVDAQAAATGATPITETRPRSLTKVLDQMVEATGGHEQYLAEWINEVKRAVDAELLEFLTRRKAQVSFPIPSNVLNFEPLAITAAASGAMLSSFREVMHLSNLLLSLDKTAQYEAAGTIWMLDPVGDPVCANISISQLESARYLWSEEAFRSSSTQPMARRYSFDVPLPAKVVDAKVAQRKYKEKEVVVFAQAVPLLAGRAVVAAWYGSMSEALEGAASGAGEERVFKLFEAALSVPIRLRLNPDEDSCRMLALNFSENVFAVSGASGADSFWKFMQKVGGLGVFKKATNLSIPKAQAALKQAGLSFKGKGLTDQLVKAMKALAPFVGDADCCAAFSMLECICPEMREPTLLMRMAQLSSARVGSVATDSLAFAFDCLRIGRLVGEIKKEDSYTVATVVGQQLKMPALIHKLFKKRDLVEFVFHEAWLVSQKLVETVAPFRTLQSIWLKFAVPPPGEQSRAAAIRKGDSAPGEGLENEFALPVAEFRDRPEHDMKVQTLIDVLWGVWCSTFDDEITELCSQELQTAAQPAFLWHRYLQESTEGLGAKYRAFSAACTSGPIPATSGAPLIIGTSELEEADKEDLLRVAETLKTLRRNTVTFVPLPTIGGASGADFSKAQLGKLWEGMRLGHKFARKKGVLRAIFLSADLFPPNVAKHAGTTSLTEPIVCDEERMTRVIDFIANKRMQHDLVILFDGRSRTCRKVMEAAEEKLAASGAHANVECWIVFAQPTKLEDPRAPGRQTSFAHNNREVALCSMPLKSGLAKLVQRSEFNSCGETATSATTYTGVPMRRFSELPRMEGDHKAGILGVAVADAVMGKRVQHDIDEKGHPFSQCEVKPLNLWQRICEHHGVTHIVDFSPGSAGLAIAAAGSMEYEGVAANELHCAWLNSTMDLVVKYMAGRDKGFARKLGGDEVLVEKVGHYFAGTMLEARRYLEPLPQEAREGDDYESSAEEEQ